MITILHGDDIAASRNFLHQKRQLVKDGVVLDGPKMTSSDLAQTLEGSSLFPEEKNIFIEDFLSKRKGKDADEIINYINKHAKDSNIFFWESKKLTAKQVGSFKGATIQEFKLPQVLFNFLDSITLPAQSISLFHQALKTTEPELVFFMMVRHFRMLLALSSPNGEQIDETARLAPWQKSKLQRQANLLGEKKLIILYKKLLEMDINMKTGGSIFNLTQAIDFFLSDL